KGLLGKQPDCTGQSCSVLLTDCFCHNNETALCAAELSFSNNRAAALNKKEHRGCDSPDADSSYVLTPSTEEKYKKINEEFDHMMRTHKIVSCLIACGFAECHAPPVFMHGVPYSSSVGAASALSDSGLLTAAHSQLQRNSSPQRPPSTGPTVNGFLSPSSGSSMGKIMAPKSPPTSSSKSKTDLRVVIPQSKNMTQNNHRQSSQPLSTPVVSMTTPSLHQSLVYSGSSSAYNNDYPQLSGFSSPSGPSLGSMATWQQHQLNSL
ncbi:hypothetical protein NL108_004605, partial [Boleophthalmus pectinirostris]